MAQYYLKFSAVISNREYYISHLVEKEINIQGAQQTCSRPKILFLSLQILRSYWKTVTHIENNNRATLKRSCTT